MFFRASTEIEILAIILCLVLMISVWEQRENRGWFMMIYDLLHSTGQDFTAAQRERAQEDFKVLFKGAPPHPPSHSHTKDSHSTGITLLFSNSAWVLLRPTELSTFKELWDGTSDLSSLSEKTRKSNHLQIILQRQHFLLSYLKTLSVGPVGISNSRPPASQPGAQPSEQPVRGNDQRRNKKHNLVPRRGWVILFSAEKSPGNEVEKKNQEEGQRDR